MFNRVASRFLLIAIIVGVAASSSAEEVTVMTYNVENMFDVYDDPYTADERADVKQRDEIAAIASTIASVDADVVVFQELENQEMLEGMVKTFLPDAGYDYIACQKTNDGRGINLGVISRYPIKRLTSYRYLTLTHPDVPDQTWRFARDAMQITLDVGGKDLHLFNVHLKSNSSSPGDPNSMHHRTAEALAVKQLVRNLLAQDPDAYVLVMGDFNSNIETRPEQDRPWPATAAFRAPEPDGGKLLIDVSDGQPYEQRTSIKGDDRYPPAVFDYIYASPALAEHLIAGSAAVIRDEALTAGSDHRPVKASFYVAE